jgi:PAS domain S-box-containing protein
MELILLLLLLSATSYLVFSDSDPLAVKLEVMAFGVLAFVIWAAVRFGVGGVSLTTLIIAAIATIETAFGNGPFAHSTPLTNAAMLDVFFTVLAVSGLSLAAAIEERERAQSERESLIREQAMMEAQARLGAIVESSEDAILGVALDRSITNWNKGAENLYGYSAGEAIGQAVDILVPDDRRHNCAMIMAKIQEGEPIQHYETVRRKKDGMKVEVSLTASPILSAEGQVIGVSSIERDIGQRRRQEQVVRDSMERFQLAAQAGRMFAYEWDALKDVVVRSAEATAILGVGASEQMTARQVMGSVHPDDRARVEGAIAAYTPEKPHLEIAYRKIRSDGEVIWVERHSVAHFDEKGKLVRVVGMVADITARKRAEAALAKARAKLIAAQEEERRRIARELHDDLGQRLALLTVELELLQDSSSVPGEVQERLSQLREESMAMAHDIQVLSHELHSAKLEYLGLGPAITGFCREFSQKQRVEVDCSAHDLPSAVPPAVSMNLFRVLQEALHNALKHSGADRFEVRLWGTGDDLQLTIRDCGAGFDSQQMREGLGLGLISMQERLEMLHGTLSIESEPNLGTTIHARVPLAGTDPMRAAG